MISRRLTIPTNNSPTNTSMCCCFSYKFLSSPLECHWSLLHNQMPACKSQISCHLCYTVQVIYHTFVQLCLSVRPFVRPSVCASVPPSGTLAGHARRPCSGMRGPRPPMRPQTAAAAGRHPRLGGRGFCLFHLWDIRTFSLSLHSL